MFQGVECYKTFSENLVRISGRRSPDQVQDLRCNLLREIGDSMIKLCLAYLNWASAWENHTSAPLGQKAGSFMDTLAIGESEAEDDGGRRFPISSSPGAS